MQTRNSSGFFTGQIVPATVQFFPGLNPETGTTDMDQVLIALQIGEVSIEKRSVPTMVKNEKTGKDEIQSVEHDFHQFKRRAAESKTLKLSDLPEEDRAVVERALEILTDAAIAKL